jgi:hypothetical protein
MSVSKNNDEIVASNQTSTSCREEHVTDSTPLLNLGALVKGTVLKRPSTQIKSPYVADVTMNDSTTALAHSPALDCTGMCVPGKQVYMSSRPQGGKTSHAIELVVSDASTQDGKSVLVGAHPRLGELIALEVLKRGLLKDSLSLKAGFQLGPVDKSTADQTISLKQ